MRAKVHLEKGPLGRTLICITEIPYGVNKADMLSKILKLSEEKKALFSGIHDIRDESDRTGLRAVIEIKKDFDAQKILQRLYKYSDLQMTFGANMVAIADGKPVQLGLIALLDAYINHQKNVITRRSQYDLEQAKARAHIVEGLIRAVDVLDEVIKTIRASKNGKDARENLCRQFGFTEIQAQAILDLRLQRLTGLEILALREEHDQLLRTIAELTAILKSEKKLLKVIQKELNEIGKQYGNDRRTQIMKEEPAEADAAEEDEDAPLPEDTVVVFNRGGQLRRMSQRLFDKLEFATPEELPRFVLRTQTDRTLLFFTNRGQCHTLAVSAVNESMRVKERGTALSGLLAGIEKDEKCVALMDVSYKEMDKLPDFIFFTRSGQVKRSKASEYAVRRQKFAALALKDGDEVIAFAQLKEKADLLMITHSGMGIRFTADSVPAQGRASGGVRGIQCSPDDPLRFGFVLGNSDELVLFSEVGYAKRIPGAMLTPQNRAGKGLKLFAFNKNGSNGAFIGAACLLSGVTQLTVVQSGGMMTPLSSELIAPQNVTDKGKPAVIALMDDIVTDVVTR